MAGVPQPRYSTGYLIYSLINAVFFNKKSTRRSRDRICHFLNSPYARIVSRKGSGDEMK